MTSNVGSVDMPISQYLIRENVLYSYSCYTFASASFLSGPFRWLKLLVHNSSSKVAGFFFCGALEAWLLALFHLCLKPLKQSLAFKPQKKRGNRKLEVVKQINFFSSWLKYTVTMAIGCSLLICSNISRKCRAEVWVENNVATTAEMTGWKDLFYILFCVLM